MDLTEDIAVIAEAVPEEAPAPEPEVEVAPEGGETITVGGPTDLPTVALEMADGLMTRSHIETMRLAGLTKTEVLGVAEYFGTTPKGLKQLEGDLDSYGEWA